jgi:predicted AAA+ superfamily ATPase
MKVKELIEKLQKFDPEIIVVVDGYEDGVNEPQDPCIININLNVNEEWYYGKHQTVYTEDKNKGDCQEIYLAR